MGGDSTLPFRTGRRGHLKLVKKKGLFQASVKIVLGDSPFSVVQRRRGNWWKGHSIVPVFRFFSRKTGWMRNRFQLLSLSLSCQTGLIARLLCRFFGCETDKKKSFSWWRSFFQINRQSILESPLCLGKVYPLRSRGSLYLPCFPGRSWEYGANSVYVEAR